MLRNFCYGQTESFGAGLQYNEMHVYTKKGVSTLTIKLQYKTISFYIFILGFISDIYMYQSLPAILFRTIFDLLIRDINNLCQSLL